MDSAKSMNLLAVAHNYRSQGKKVALCKPRVDDRSGLDTITSRTGLEAKVDVLLEPETKIDFDRFADLDCVLVDEAQFLAPRVVDQLRQMTHDLGVPVICYGLRTDLRTELFPGSKRLMEVADSIEEIKVTCRYCNRKAIFNMRLVDGIASRGGPQVQIGGNESYAPVCYRHYAENAGFRDEPG
jgi:thymidine kinase